MIDLFIIRWELVVAVIAVGLLLADLFLTQVSKRTLGLISAALLGIYLIWNFFFEAPLTSRFETAHGFYTLDALAVWGKQFSVFTTILTILMSLRFMRSDEEHFLEYILLQLTACISMMLVASTSNFLSLFVFLELMTVSFYVLVSFRKHEVLCLEAGLKYLISGALASGILLYGIALIYGTTGQVDFHQVGSYLVAHPHARLTLTGFVLVLTGIAFKISAVPFHWWTADVYEGAPTPTVSLLSIGSKSAGFFLLIRMMIEAFPSKYTLWLPLICFAAGASILVGNLGALSQSNLKRLMGYSSISHTGYLLLGIAAASPLSQSSILTSLSAVLYYLVGYLLANALIFSVMCETNQENPRQDIRYYSGLGNRSHLLAGSLTLGLLSLSGIPPLAGFFGKLVLFRAAFENRFYVLLGISLIGVICSLYYYLGILRTIYFTETTDLTAQKTFTLTRLILVFLMAGVVIVGFYQSPWWEASIVAIRSIRP